MFLRGFQLSRIDRLATVYLCHPAAKLTGWTSKYIKGGASNDKDRNSHGSGGVHRLSHGQIPSAPGLECGRYVRLRGIALISKAAKLTVRTMRSPEWAARDTGFGPVSTYAYLPLGST